MNKHIVLVCGSASVKSTTLILLRYIERLLQQKNITTTVWNLREKPLPMVDPEDESEPSAIVEEFSQLIKNADGFIIGTPVYHGSYSGLLKNAVDNLDSDSFKNKFVGVVSSAGGVGNTQALEHLRTIIRTLYGYALQTQIATAEEDYQDGKLVSSSIRKRCKRLVEELENRI